MFSGSFAKARSMSPGWGNAALPAVSIATVAEPAVEPGPSRTEESATLPITKLIEEEPALEEPAPIVSTDAEPLEIGSPIVIRKDDPVTSSGKPKDDRFYFNFTTFEAEGMLFRVPRHPFEMESPVFKDMFSMPADSLTDGCSDESPLILPGVRASDFRTFLKALLDPTAQDPQNALDKDGWASALHLSRMWCCDRLIALTISKLEAEITDPIDRILFANVHNIEEWLVSSYLQLATRTDPLTAEETKKIGVENAVKLNELRESRYRWIIDDIEEARSNPNRHWPYSSNKKRRRKNARARSPVNFRFVRRDAELLNDDLRNSIRQFFGLI